MGDTDEDLEVDDVASGVLVDVVGVVLELEALAEVLVAVLGEALPPGGGAHESLGVRGVVGVVEIDQVLTADGCRGLAGAASYRGLDKAVALDEGCESREAEDCCGEHGCEGEGVEDG